mgnify:CR=1 FL=1
MQTRRRSLSESTSTVLPCRVRVRRLSLCQVEIQGFGRQEIVAFRRQQHAANRVGGRIGQVEIQDRRQPLHIEADPFAAVIDAFR